MESLWASQIFNSLDWGFFLSNRKIQVVVDGLTFYYHSIIAGVPQGSVLSPTLFLIFINDLLSTTTNQIHSFADDSTLSSHYSFHSSAHCSSLAVTSERIQMGSSITQDLNLIDKWGIANRVEFNVNKFQTCLISCKHNPPSSIFSLNGNPVSNSPSVQMLGMNLTSGLSWQEKNLCCGKELCQLSWLSSAM